MLAFVTPGMTEIDSDLDGVADCLDQCPGDATKTLFGACGCGCHGSIESLT